MQPTILITYLLPYFILVFFRGPAIKTFSQYALGGLHFPTYILTLSTVACQINWGSILAVVDVASNDGIIFMVSMVFIVFKWLLFGKCISNGLDNLKQHQCVTLPDIMNVFYGKIGALCATLGLIQYVFFLGALYKILGSVIEKYLGIPIIYGSSIVAVAVTIYSIFARVNIVVATDVVQLIIFLTILSFLLIFGVTQLDLNVIFKNIPSEKLTIKPHQYYDLLNQILYVLVSVTGFDTIQRLLMCKDKVQVKNLCKYSGFICFIFGMTMSVIGLLSSALGAREDNSIFFFFNRVIPSDFHPLIVVSFLATIMSTANAFLNSINIILMKNVFSRICDIEAADIRKKLPIIQTVLSLLVSGIAFSTVFINKATNEIFYLVDSFWDPLISIPLVMGLIGYTITQSQFKYLVIICSIIILVCTYYIGLGSIATWSLSVVSSLISIIFLRNQKVIFPSKRNNTAE